MSQQSKTLICTLLGCACVRLHRKRLQNINHIGSKLRYSLPFTKFMMIIMTNMPAVLLEFGPLAKGQNLGKVPASFLLCPLHGSSPRGPTASQWPNLFCPSVVIWDWERKSLHVVQQTRLVANDLVLVSPSVLVFFVSFFLVFVSYFFGHLHNSWVGSASLLELLHCQPIILTLEPLS